MISQNVLQQFRCLDKSSSEFHDKLSNIFYGKEYNQGTDDLQGDDLVWLVDYLDEILNILDPASPCFRKCLRELRSICGNKMILPTPYTFSPPVLNVSDRPVASGGSGDIFKGTLNRLSICVKRIRVYSKDGPEKATKVLYQEAVVCKRLAHPNIVPLLGITITPLQLISEWMPGGNLTECIEERPDADRLGLLSDVAEGLHFLHSRNIVHGDLKGPNILVDASGRARITDFGLARVTQNLDSLRSASGDQGHTARWTAPEILTEEGEYSKEADVFSFAMVMIEVFTGAVPFNDSPSPAAMFAIMGGRRPPRPTHPALTEQLWTLMQCCWYQNPHSRPEVSKVLKVLGGSESLSVEPALHSPSQYNAVSSSPNRTSLDESENARQYGSPQLATRGLPSVTHHYHSAMSEPSPIPIDLQPLDLSHLDYDRVHDHAGGAGRSRADLQSTLGGDTPRRDVSSKDSRAGESLEIELGSRLSALIETCSRIPTATKGVADLQRRCVLLYEVQYEHPTPAGSTLEREWTKVMKAAITTTSAAEERVRFWTTKNRWRKFIRFGGNATKDIEYATKEINRIAGELLLFKQIHDSERQNIGRPF